MRPLLLLALLLPLLPLRAEVVRPVPDLPISVLSPETGASRPSTILRAFKGQPMILIIAPSPRSGVFRKQLALMEKHFRYFASRKAVILAAFTEDSTPVIPTDMPVLTLPDGPAAAAALRLAPGKSLFGKSETFALGVVGPDGNLDLLTTRPASGARILSVMENTYTLQAIKR